MNWFVRNAVAVFTRGLQGFGRALHRGRVTDQLGLLVPIL